MERTFATVASKSPLALRIAPSPVAIPTPVTRAVSRDTFRVIVPPTEKTFVTNAVSRDIGPGTARGLAPLVSWTHGFFWACVLIVYPAEIKCLKKSSYVLRIAGLSEAKCDLRLLL